MTLGLDLQGGVNILLEIDRDDLKKRLTEQLSSDIRSTLREAKIGYSGINRDRDGVRVRITKPEDVDKAVTDLRKLLQPVEAGGLFGAAVPRCLFDVARRRPAGHLHLQRQGHRRQDRSRRSASRIKIVEKRVNPDGVVEATIQQQGKDRIVVQLPGVQDSQEGEEPSRPHRQAHLPAAVRGAAHGAGPEPAARVQGAAA